MTADEIPEGDLIDHVNDDLFGDQLGALDAHTSRLQAIAHPHRYAIVHLLYEHGDTRLTQENLRTATGLPTPELMSHLKPLLDVNLITKIPHPSDDAQTEYRITTLGRLTIASDRHYFSYGTLTSTDTLHDAANAVEDALADEDDVLDVTGAFESVSGGEQAVVTVTTDIGDMDRYSTVRDTVRATVRDVEPENEMVYTRIEI